MFEFSNPLQADGVEAHVARVVCEQRLALLPRFKDADKAHTGTVTRYMTPIYLCICVYIHIYI